MATNTFGDDARLVLDALSDPIVVMDERMVVTSANRAAGNFVGVAPSDLIGRHAIDWVHEPDRSDATDRLLAFLERRSGHPVSIRFSRADGSVVWAEVTGAVIELDGSTRVALSLRNVDWRHTLDLETARIQSRAHLLVELVMRLQFVGPGELLGGLDDAVGDIGASLEATVVSVHELEAQLAQMTLRSRWVNPRDQVASRTIPPSSVPGSDLLALVSPLEANDPPVVGVSEGQRIAGLRRIEPALGSGLGVALRTAERTVGALTVGWARQHDLTNSERDHLARVARVLAVTIDRVRCHGDMAGSEAIP